jgi:hypothetical protein
MIFVAGHDNTWAKRLSSANPTTVVKNVNLAVASQARKFIWGVADALDEPDDELTPGRSINRLLLLLVAGTIERSVAMSKRKLARARRARSPSKVGSKAGRRQAAQPHAQLNRENPCSRILARGACGPSASEVRQCW